MVEAIVGPIGRTVLSVFNYIFNIFLMVYLTFRATFKDQAQGIRTLIGVISSQIYFTGVLAMPLMAVLSFFMGALIAFQFQTQLTFIGNAAYIGNMMVVVVFRELAPLATALLVVARSGTAVASEIGSMKAHREIEALEVMGIHPLSYIVFPRVIGGLVSVLGLSIFFCMIACFGSFVFCHLLLSMPLSFFLDALSSSLTSSDWTMLLLKNSVSGLIIFIVCCYEGLRLKGSPHEIPQVTTRAVVHSVILVTLFNFTVSGLFYLNQFTKMGFLT